MLINNFLLINKKNYLSKWYGLDNEINCNDKCILRMK